jgi:hypothetical protein
MDRLHIAVFHALSDMGSAWSYTSGVHYTLNAMGHNAFDAGDPRYSNVPIELLEDVDVIFVVGLEWFDTILIERYGEAWGKLRAVKVGLYFETAHRDDRDFPYGNWRQIVDLPYFPACQDAEEFGGTWLPFGADTTMFAPQASVAKQVDVGFIGQMYQKRLDFCARINAPIVRVMPEEDKNMAVSFRHLVRAYCAIRIFVNLPSLSRLLVTKVSEIMACGTMLITPKMDHPSAVRNTETFEDGKHLVYYDPSSPEDLKEKIAFYLSRPDLVEQVSQAGYREILRAHTMVHKLRIILADVAKHPKLGRN